MRLDASAYIEVGRDAVADDTIIIVGWSVEEGLAVQRGDKICEIETSKSIVELYAHLDGWLFHLQFDGDEVPVGEPLGVISPQPEKPTLAQTPSKIVTNGSTKGATALHPSLGNSMHPTGGTVLPLNPRQRRAAKILSASHNLIPQGYISKWLDLKHCREHLQRLDARHDEGEALIHLLAYACAQTAPNHGKANSRWSDLGITFHESINLGLVINQDNGDLIAPIVHASEQLNFTEISSRLHQLCRDAKEQRLSIDDMSDGTIAITSAYGTGSQQIFPMVAPGTSTIIALGDELDGKICLTLGFDYRILNTAESGAYLSAIATHMQNGPPG